MTWRQLRESRERRHEEAMKEEHRCLRRPWAAVNIVEGGGAAHRRAVGEEERRGKDGGDDPRAAAARASRFFRAPGSWMARIASQNWRASTRGSFFG